MNRLIRLLAKHHVLLLFVLLEFIALILVFQGKNHHRSAFISSANSVTGNTYDVFQNFSDYVGLKEVNEQLALENALLKAQLENAKEIVDTSETTIGDTTSEQAYTFQAGKVISNTTRIHHNNFLTINLGRNHGIMSEMGVIGSKGVIGFVGAVSDNYSMVYSFLNKSTRVPISVKRNNATGTIHWIGNNIMEGTINNIPITTKIVIGDSILTSGYSAIYPKGLFIGTVAKIEPSDDQQKHVISVNLSEDFNALSYVYVVKSLTKNELDSLKQDQDKLSAADHP